MKVFKVLNRILDAVMMVFFVIVFLIGLYSMIDSMMVYNHASDDSLLKYKPGNGNSSVEELKGNVAWLTIDDTNIDYPVMQGKDNTEYLNKDPYGDFSLSGSIFLDSNNHPDFSDPYNLVYGHHMEGNRMFGQLDSFLDKSFFDSHRHGTLIVGNEEYEIELIASLQTTADDKTIFNVDETDVNSVLKDISEKAVVDESTGSETHLIALSTCRDTDTSARTIVIGSLGEKKAVKMNTEKTAHTERIRNTSSIVPWIILAAVVVLVIVILTKKRRK